MEIKKEEIILFVVSTWGKVRAMINHEGKNINEAHPSMPVEILGMNSSAFAGAEFCHRNEDEAKEIVEFKKNNSTTKENNIT